MPFHLTETTVDALKEAYSFQNLQDFLDLYYEGASVLLTEEDFYDLTLAYLECVHQQACKRVEFFFDPQTHTARGVPFESIMNGMNRAIQYACNVHDDLSVGIILCFLRHLSEEEAFETLEQAMAFREDILGVGLDSTELNHPPSKFERVFEKARAAGFHVVAHAGEEGSAQCIEDTLNILKAERIDHGIKCLQDNALVQRLVREQIPLTTCPLSNVKLRVVKDMSEFPLMKMMEAGLLVTINSDDPAYFGGYLNDNYLAVAQTFDLSRDDLRLLAKNSFQATFASEQEKEKWIGMVDEYCDNYESN